MSSFTTDSRDGVRYRNEPPPPYSERADGNMSNGYGAGASRPPPASRQEENIPLQIIKSFPYFVQSAISLFKELCIWLFYKGLFGLLLLTPIGPIWLLYNKGLDIISYIPIAMQFFKDLSEIGKKCSDDALNKTGYMDSKEIKRDLRATLLRLLGYEYTKPELDQEMTMDDDDNDSLPQDTTSKERLKDVAVYTATLGHYPQYLVGRGITPPSRTTHRTRQANKSRLAAFALSFVGMAFFVVSGKFLFKNVTAYEKKEKEMDNDTASQKSGSIKSNSIDEPLRKFNWKYIYAGIIIIFGLWWLMSSPDKNGAPSYTTMLVSAILSPFTFTFGWALSLIGWSWSKFFAVCFFIPRMILGFGNDKSDEAHHKSL